MELENLKRDLERVTKLYKEYKEKALEYSYIALTLDEDRRSLEEKIVERKKAMGVKDEANNN